MDFPPKRVHILSLADSLYHRLRHERAESISIVGDAELGVRIMQINGFQC